MTLKEFLKMNKNNGYLDIVLYDKNWAYYGCYPKRYIQDSGVVNEKVISFELKDYDLCIQLDF